MPSPVTTGINQQHCGSKLIRTHTHTRARAHTHTMHASKHTHTRTQNSGSVGMIGINNLQFLTRSSNLKTSVQSPIRTALIRDDVNMILNINADLPDQCLVLTDKQRQNTLLFSTYMSHCLKDSSAVTASTVALSVHKVKQKGA